MTRKINKLVLSAILASSFFGCAGQKTEIKQDSALSFGIERADSVDSLLNWEVDVIGDALINKQDLLKPDEKELAYNIGCKTLKILDNTLLAPMFGNCERIIGRHVPVSIGGKEVVYQQIGPKKIMEYFSRAVKCFKLSEKTVEKKDLELILQNLKVAQEFNSFEVKSESDAIKEYMYSLLRQFIRSNDSENGIDFVVRSINDWHSFDVGAVYVFEKCSVLDLPKNENSASILLQVISENRDCSGLLGSLIERGFIPNKKDALKYYNRVMLADVCAKELFFVQDKYAISPSSELVEYGERKILKGTKSSYHDGILALKYAKSNNLKLRDYFFSNNIAANVDNLELDSGDIVEFCEIYARPVNEKLSQRFNLLLESQLTLASVVECVKIAALMHANKNPQYEFIEDFAFKSLSRPILDDSKKFKNIRKKTRYEGIAFADETEVIGELCKSPNSQKYLKYAHDILFESGYHNLAKLCTQNLIN